ncbi:MAG: alpha/beta hydrolase-fold protein [Prosthecobacter sp.]|nr:alpha/beta hydrolase-fold protein [Prosthecobacter sp.]
MRLFLPLFCSVSLAAAEPEFTLTADSRPQPGILTGTLLKDTYTASENSVYPGTVREYQIYLPHGFDKSKAAPFMVFQDGVIHQAPVVFDNLIAKKDIPPIVGLFIKPGVVPAANDNALPRFNRSYEYDSITVTYSQFLIDEFLPALETKHGLKFSTDPNDTAISGNSSGGICAFMAAWHRPDRFRRVFTGVGTYVGIHGADQLPVLIRKIEPKPLRVFLQSGTGDNNLYCGDWWMANQMMERSLTWAGYDVNHAWGEGGHNQKHASQIFPDAMRWLWRDWQTDKTIKANAKAESKWKGYEILTAGDWQAIPSSKPVGVRTLASNLTGDIYYYDSLKPAIFKLAVDSTKPEIFKFQPGGPDSIFSSSLAFSADGRLCCAFGLNFKSYSETNEKAINLNAFPGARALAISHSGRAYFGPDGPYSFDLSTQPGPDLFTKPTVSEREFLGGGTHFCLTPDQTLLYSTSDMYRKGSIISWQIQSNGTVANGQVYGILEMPVTIPLEAGGLCVDTEGRLYVATSLGIQVCDQAGRVNFIIPTPKPPYDWGALSFWTTK